MADKHISIKKKLRDLKKQETRIRFSNIQYNCSHEVNTYISQRLVWNEFFSVNRSDKVTRYSLEMLSALDKEELKKVIDEFFYAVYYRYYLENGIKAADLYDPCILGNLGLPPDAGAEMIKKRFRDLAKKYHPDKGGNANDFIKLIEDYNNLIT